MSADFKKTLDTFMTEHYGSFKNSGYLRITLKDEIIYENSIGYADREKKTEFSSDSMFTFYSVSKPFCAIALLKLYDRGLIDIDRSPGEYVPQALGFDSRVTVRHLLQHISGIPDFVQTAKFQETLKI